MFAAGEILKFKAAAVAPLHAGFGVRGWISVRAPEGDLGHFTDERLRLLEGLSYRASVALQKSVLLQSEQASAEVASALLEFSRRLAGVSGQDELHRRIVELTGEMLDSPRTWLWLERGRPGSFAIAAAWRADGAVPIVPIGSVVEFGGTRRALERGEPFVLEPGTVNLVPEGEDPLAVAPVVLPSGPDRLHRRGRARGVRGAEAPPARRDRQPGEPGAAHLRELEAVAQEEVLAVQAGRAQRAAMLLLGQQRDALDDREPVLGGRAAGEQRRDGQEQLVDEALADERAEQPRSGLAEDPPVAALAQEAHGRRDVDGGIAGDDRELGFGRQPALEDAGARVRSRARARRRGAPGAPGSGGPSRSRPPTRAGSGAERPERLGRVGKHRVGAPEPLRRGLQRPAADEDGVGRRAEQPHHEPVGGVAAGDQAVRALERRDRDDAVERRDEVREQRLLRKRRSPP